jgi:AraC-like DNA-binding protein
MHSEDLPTADRFEWWCEQVAKDVAPTVSTSPCADDFRAVVTYAELGPVCLSVLAYSELRSVRTPAMIRRSDPERYGLTLITRNGLWFAQRGGDCRLGAGDLLVFDSSQPFDTRVLSAGGLGQVVMLNIPKAALPLRQEQMNGLLARRLPGDAGMNTVLAGYLGGLAAAVSRGEVGKPETERLGELALHLAAATLAAQIDDEDRLSPEARRRALLSRIEAHIELNLDDPELTPAEIAAHHRISVGYLHRIFRSHELTVTAWIRHRRLERCRADLADPRLRSRPVHAVGARWGMRDAAHFSRVFRAAYGAPPAEYRRAALTAGTAAEV